MEKLSSKNAGERVTADTDCQRTFIGKGYNHNQHKEHRFKGGDGVDSARFGVGVERGHLGKAEEIGPALVGEVL